MAKMDVEPKVKKDTDAFRAAISEIYAPPDHDGKRRDLLRSIEKQWGLGTKVISYMANSASPFSGIGPDDIGPVASALQKIKHANRLLFLIHSGGGDGYTAQKIVDVCRSHCKTFVVCVPNWAKSAATLIALGADQIAMGYLSELGPIDPQIPVTVSGERHYVSANSFIEAKEALEKRIAEKQAANEPTLPYLQELSGLDVAFVRECERMTEWGRQFAIKYLSQYMLAKRGTTKAATQAKAATIANDLSTKHLQHGELIGPRECRKLGLDILALKRNDRRWKLVWEYFVRAAIYFTLPQDGGKTHVAKIFETPEATLAAKGPSF
jgi:hypothetical protein